MHNSVCVCLVCVCVCVWYDTRLGFFSLHTRVQLRKSVTQPAMPIYCSVCIDGCIERPCSVPFL
jgi:hypothetical protein